MKQEYIDNIRKNLIIVGQCCRCGERLVLTDPFYITGEGGLVDTYCAEVEIEELYKPKIVHNVLCVNCMNTWNAIMPDFVREVMCPTCGKPILLTNEV